MKSIITSIKQTTLYLKTHQSREMMSLICKTICCTFACFVKVNGGPTQYGHIAPEIYLNV